MSDWPSNFDILDDLNPEDTNLCDSFTQPYAQDPMGAFDFSTVPGPMIPPGSGFIQQEPLQTGIFNDQGPATDPGLLSAAYPEQVTFAPVYDMPGFISQAHHGYDTFNQGPVAFTNTGFDSFNTGLSGHGYQDFGTTNAASIDPCFDSGAQHEVAAIGLTPASDDVAKERHADP